MGFVRSLLLIAMLWPTTSLAGKVQWFEGTLEQALNQAQSEKKHLLIVVHSWGCGPCELFLNEIIEKDEIAAFVNKATVPIKTESGDDHLYFERFKVYGYPTIILTRPDGEEVSRIPYPERIFLPMLRKEIAEGKTIPELQREISNNPDNVELKVSVYKKYLERFSTLAARVALNSIDALHREYFEANKATLLYLLGESLARSDQYDEAIEEFQKVLTFENVDPNIVHAVYYQLAFCYFYQHKYDETFAVLNTGIDKFPESITLHSLYVRFAVRVNKYLDQAVVYGLKLIDLMTVNEEKAWANYLVSTVYYAKEDKANALKYIDEALVLAPGDQDYLEFKKQIEQMP